MMKRILLVLLLLFLSNPAFALTQWCDDADAKGCWNIETGSATTMVDQTSNSNDGSFKGAGEPNWDGVELPDAGDGFDGTSTYSVEFDGTDDYVSVPDSADFDVATALTITAWFNVDVVGTNQIIVKKFINDLENKVLYLFDGGATLQISFYLFPMSVEATGTTNLSINTWYHSAGTYDGTSVKVYLNGVEEDSENDTDDIRDNSGNVGIGQDVTDNTGSFNGNIDEILWLKRALDSTDINDILDNGLVQSAAPTGAPPQIW